MNKIFAYAVVASVLVASLAAQPLFEDGLDYSHQESLHGPREKRAVSSVLVASLAAQPLYEDGLDFEHHESLQGPREKRAVSCASVSSQPRNPSSYYEACRAHCILNGKKGGSCVGGSCSCY